MKKAMIFGAGLGTRLKPFTLNHPKALAPVNGKPLLQRNIEYLASFGVKEVVINVHHFADQIIAFLDENDFGVRTIISHERDDVLETGGGLLFARNLLEDAQDILVMNVDILTDINLTELIKAHQKNDALATLAVSTRESSRGLLFNKEFQLCGWHNKKTGEEKLVIPDLSKSELKDFAFSGIQVISSKVFDLIPFMGKFSIIDVYLHLAKENKILGYDHSGNILLDVGKPESISKAEKLFD